MNPKATKTTVKMMMAAFALIAIVCISAFAASVIMSIHLTQTVTVPESTVTLTNVTPIPGTPAKGVAYDYTTHVTYYVAVTNATATLTITNAAISTSDVTVFYNGTELEFIDGGNYLHVEFVIPATSTDITLAITFNTGGTYTTDLVVGATV